MDAIYDLCMKIELMQNNFQVESLTFLLLSYDFISIILYLKSSHFICFGSFLYLHFICLIILPTSISLKISTYTNHSTPVFCILRLGLFLKKSKGE